MFTLECTSDRIWNYVELIDYLVRNQNDTIDIKVNPEAICLANVGLYKILDCFNFQQVNIRTNNPLEAHTKYNVILEKNLRWLIEEVQPIDPELFTWTQKKLFFCLFGRPTAGRLALGAYINKHHAEQSLVHFSATTHHDNLINFELDKLLNMRVDSVEEVGELVRQLPILLSNSDRYTAFDGYDYSDPLTQFYKDILIDIVVESHVSGKTFYITEKTIRPIRLKKPFIMFASRDYLDYLHQMGFKTFNNFWDETYDGYEGRDRLIKILKLIDELSRKSRQELIAMYNNMTEILDYNYNLLLNKKFNQTIKEIV
jgi:hypothetical protein